MKEHSIAVQRIIQLQHYFKLSQKEFELKCNIGKGLMSQWIQGYKEPGMVALKRIASACQVSLDWIFGSNEVSEIPGYEKLTIDQRLMIKKFVQFLVMEQSCESIPTP